MHTTAAPRRIRCRIPVASARGENFAAALHCTSEGHISVLYTVCLLMAAASADTTSAAVPTYTIQTVAGGAPAAGSAPGTLRQPEGVVLSVRGDIYFSDALAHVVRRVDTSGNVTTIAGTGAA